MPRVTIDGMSFHTEDLDSQAQEVLDALLFIQERIKKLQEEVRVYQIAFRAHKSEMKSEIERLSLPPISAGKDGA